jgi:cytochrome c peroxidase
VGCAECHAGSLFTDGLNHDVGLGNASDKYKGFNTPSLVGVYAKVRLLHDGRAKSLEDVLTKWHTPSEIGGGAELTSEQLEQLVAYLKTL